MKGTPPPGVVPEIPDLATLCAMKGTPPPGVVPEIPDLA